MGYVNSLEHIPKVNTYLEATKNYSQYENEEGDEWEDNGDSGVVSLAQPLKVHELISTMEMVVSHAERIRRKRRTQPRRRTGEEKALIDRAKAVLMERNNMTEAEAHRYLQKTSMDNGTGFTETAQMILSMMDL